MRERGPQHIDVENPGEGFWEQIRKGDLDLYAVYEPPSKLLQDAVKEFKGKKTESRYTEEHIRYESRRPGEYTDKLEIDYVPLKKCPWPLPGEPLEPGDDLWRDVRQFIYDHVDLPDDRLYDLLTAWIMATWLREAWPVVPYIFFHGPVSSGKTRGLEVLHALCYRAIMGCNMSESAVFRAVERWKPTVLLDETEIYTKEGRTAVQNLLNAGYRRNQYAIRVRTVEKGTPVLDLFDVFGFKALAGTKGFKDTLESRSIAINMGKNLRKIRFQIDKEGALKLRSRLLLWRWRRLFDGLDGFDGFLGGVPKLLNFTDGRVMELFSCLVAVTNEGREAIISYARKLHNERIDAEETSIEAEVTETIAKCAGSVVNNRFSTAIIRETFNQPRPEKEKWKTTSIGWVIKRLGFKKKRMQDGTRGWLWNERLLRRWMKRYGIPPTILEKPSSPSKPSNPDIANAPLQEKMDFLLGELSCAGGGSTGELAEKLGVPVREAARILGRMQLEGRVFMARADFWKAVSG